MATVGEQTPIVSNHTRDKATKAKVTLENYYSNLVSQHEERENRWVKVENHLAVKVKGQNVSHLCQGCSYIALNLIKRLNCIRNSFCYKFEILIEHKTQMCLHEPTESKVKLGAL